MAELEIKLPARGKLGELIVGIDLGTTNSLVAYMEGGIPQVITDEEGRALLPSVVAFGPDGPIVGGAAKRQLIRNAARAVYSIKRFMGKGYADVKEELRYFPFRVTPSQDVVRIRIADRELTPPEVSALILKELRRRAERHFGRPVEKAVITVPAYFNDSQRQATKDAGRIAGFDVLRIVNEPTAACLAYGLQRKKEGIIAVYDLGGGTFDISILKVKEGIFEVLSTNGDTHLGGDDFDRILVDMTLAEIREQRGTDVSGDAEAMQEIRLGAEAARVRLSSAEQTVLTIPMPQHGFAYRRELTRTELEALIEPVVERTLGPCRMALADAGVAAARIDEVVLVGGATRTPLVRRRVEELFGKTPHAELNPDEVVALGAAVQADILAGGITHMLLLDVTPLSLGIETLGGAVGVLIPRNTTIPTSAKEDFTTSVDGQTVVDMHVVQGERDLAKDNRSLARFELRGIPPMPGGLPRIEVMFLIDANGILNVAAKELRSGTQASVEVRPTYGLTEAEVQRMIEESLEFAEPDVRARMLIDARNEADTVLRATDKALAQPAGLISDEEAGRIRAAAAALRGVRDGADTDRIRAATDRLNHEAQHLAELLMDSALREALQHRRVTEAIEKK
ncbi:MAG: Fe-S protein assembly chaperone HscA [Candidatus Rokubacteria bacterium]|nr:Fe-S protein assembly chaperone HscA [Candidatus Rokubacteria bacterium]